MQTHSFVGAVVMYSLCVCAATGTRRLIFYVTCPTVLPPVCAVWDPNMPGKCLLSRFPFDSGGPQTHPHCRCKSVPLIERDTCLCKCHSSCDGGCSRLCKAHPTSLRNPGMSSRHARAVFAEGGRCSSRKDTRKISAESRTDSHRGSRLSSGAKTLASVSARLPTTFHKNKFKSPHLYTLVYD